VLSLQALPRRLTLDFRDVFSSGFAFDFVRGDAKVTHGVARTNNLQMKGVNAAVLMDGQVNLDAETQDLRVVVVPEINAGTAALATAINPAIGLGAFVAQLVLAAAGAGRHARVPDHRQLGRSGGGAGQAVGRCRGGRRFRCRRGQRTEGEMMHVAAIQMVSGTQVEPNLRAARALLAEAAAAAPSWRCCPSISASWAGATPTSWRCRSRWAAGHPGLAGRHRARAGAVDRGRHAAAVVRAAR
jgi:hypothetical protein